MTNKMNVYGLIVVLLGVLSQVEGMSLTLDHDAQKLCKKYKILCKAQDVCAVQHFNEPKMTMPVCIPLSFVPVRNRVCRLAPEKGLCFARYIRWHYNIHQQGCVHFQYGGCGGNQNNFRTKEECENACLRTPTIQLIDGGEIKPAIMTAPEYKPPQKNKYEALNSVMMTSPEYNNNYDRYQTMKHRINRVKPNNEVSTRKRRRLEKERAAKERRRRERRKEKRRLRKLKKRQRRKEKKRGGSKKKKGKRKKNKLKKKAEIEVVNETVPDEEKVEIAELNAEIVEEAEKIVNNEIETLEEEEAEEQEEERIKKERRKERKRKKRRQRRKKRRLNREKRHKKSSSKYAELKGRPESTMFKMFRILDDDNPQPQDNSLMKSI